jgi:hypothetical protein
LHYLPDPISGEDMHYKSFEKLYDKKITENYKLSLKNTKMKMNSKVVFTRAKYIMPFCSFAIQSPLS